MEKNTQRKITGGIIYIILALLIVAIMCIAVLTIANTGKYSEKERRKQAETVTTALSETISPETVIPETVTENEATSALDTSETTEAMAFKDNIDDIIDDDSDMPAAASVENDSDIEPVNAPLKFVMPTRGYISKDYDNEILVYSLTMNDYRVHTGIDIDSTIGAPVYACADGIIKNIYDDPFMGKCIIVDHGDGLKSYYMNLSNDIPQGISENCMVESGQVIAGIGETSMLEIADNMHLHFEMKVNGENVDPLNYIPYDISTAVTYSDN